MKELIKQEIIEFGYINTARYSKKHHVNERVIRSVISELRKDGVILIPVQTHLYINVNKVSEDIVEDFVRTQIKSMRTQYFNTLKPIKDYVQDEKLKTMIGGLFGVMEELQ